MYGANEANNSTGNTVPKITPDDPNLSRTIEAPKHQKPKDAPAKNNSGWDDVPVPAAASAAADAAERDSKSPVVASGSSASSPASAASVSSPPATAAIKDEKRRPMNVADHISNIDIMINNFLNDFLEKHPKCQLQVLIYEARKYIELRSYISVKPLALNRLVHQCVIRLFNNFKNDSKQQEQLINICNQLIKDKMLASNLAAKLLELSAQRNFLRADLESNLQIIELASDDYSQEKTSAELWKKAETQPTQEDKNSASSSSSAAVPASANSGRSSSSAASPPAAKKDNKETKDQKNSTSSNTTPSPITKLTIPEFNPSDLYIIAHEIEDYSLPQPGSSTPHSPIDIKEMKETLAKQADIFKHDIRRSLHPIYCLVEKIVTTCSEEKIAAEINALVKKDNLFGLDAAVIVNSLFIIKAADFLKDRRPFQTTLYNMRKYIENSYIASDEQKHLMLGFLVELYVKQMLTAVPLNKEYAISVLETLVEYKAIQKNLAAYIFNIEFIANRLQLKLPEEMRNTIEIAKSFEDSSYSRSVVGKNLWDKAAILLDQKHQPAAAETKTSSGSSASASAVAASRPSSSSSSSALKAESGSPAKSAPSKSDRSPSSSSSPSAGASASTFSSSGSASAAPATAPIVTAATKLIKKTGEELLEELKKYIAEQCKENRTPENLRNLVCKYIEEKVNPRISSAIDTKTEPNEEKRIAIENALKFYEKLFKMQLVDKIIAEAMIAALNLGTYAIEKYLKKFFSDIFNKLQEKIAAVTNQQEKGADQKILKNLSEHLLPKSKSAQANNTSHSLRSDSPITAGSAAAYAISRPTASQTVATPAPTQTTPRPNP